VNLTADSDKGKLQHLESTAAVTGDKLGGVSDGGAHACIHQGDCSLNDNGLLHCEEACDVTDFPSKYDVPSRKVKRGYYDDLGLNKVGQVADVIDDKTCIKVMHDDASKDDDSADDARLCLNTSYFESTYAKKSQKPEENVTSSDDRMLTADKLRAKVCENNNLSNQTRKAKNFCFYFRCRTAG
jgi:hypothetical protein